MKLEVMTAGELDRLAIDSSRLVGIGAEVEGYERTPPEVEQKRGGGFGVWGIDAIDQRVSPAEVTEVVRADLAFVDHLLEALARLFGIETERWFPYRQRLASQRRCCLDERPRRFSGDWTSALKMQVVAHAASILSCAGARMRSPFRASCRRRDGGR